MLGVIDANPAHADSGLLDDPRILGVRFTLPRVDLNAFERRRREDAAGWSRLFDALAHRKRHVLLYAVDPRVCRAAMRWIPAEIPLGLDHMGLFDASSDAALRAFETTLDAAVERGNVYFKGPGYRAATDPMRVAPAVRRVMEKAGPDRLLLGATDAPNVGTESTSGVPFREWFADVPSVMRYTQQLAEAACQEPISGVRVEPGHLLQENALNLYADV